MSSAAAAFEAMAERVGEDQGAGDWFTVTQEQIDRFADVTLDHQFIHVDPEQAAAVTPFGGRIAHGFLVLSMLVHLQESIPAEPPPLDGILMGVNYGFDRVRFVNPVPSGARIRAVSEISDVELKGPSVQITRTMTIEIEGVEKPAMVAEWIGRVVYDS